MLPGSSYHQICLARNATTHLRKIPKIVASMGDFVDFEGVLSLPMSPHFMRILGKFDPCRCFCVRDGHK